MKSSWLSKVSAVSAAVVAGLTVTGCGTKGSVPKPYTLGPAAKIAGTVRGGQQPVSGATIQLYAVNTVVSKGLAAPLIVSPGVTDAQGNFDITGDYVCPTAGALVYLVATGGNPGLPGTVNNAQIAEMALLGTCGSLRCVHVYQRERTDDGGECGGPGAVYGGLRARGQRSGKSERTGGGVCGCGVTGGRFDGRIPGGGNGDHPADCCDEHACGCPGGVREFGGRRGGGRVGVRDAAGQRGQCGCDGYGGSDAADCGLAGGECGGVVWADRGSESFSASAYGGSDGLCGGGERGAAALGDVWAGVSADGDRRGAACVGGDAGPDGHEHLRYGADQRLRQRWRAVVYGAAGKRRALSAGADGG